MIILNSATIWAPTLWHMPWLRWRTNTTSSLKEWRKLTLQAGGLSLHLYLTSTSKSHEMTAKMRQKEQIHDETENRSGGVHWLPQAKPRSSCLNVDSQSSPDICDKPATHERRTKINHLIKDSGGNQRTSTTFKKRVSSIIYNSESEALLTVWWARVSHTPPVGTPYIRSGKQLGRILK